MTRKANAYDLTEGKDHLATRWHINADGTKRTGLEAERTVFPNVAAEVTGAEKVRQRKYNFGKVLKVRAYALKRYLAFIEDGRVFGVVVVIARDVQTVKVQGGGLGKLLEKGVGVYAVGATDSNTGGDARAEVLILGPNKSGAVTKVNNRSGCGGAGDGETQRTADAGTTDANAGFVTVSDFGAGRCFGYTDDRGHSLVVVLGSSHVGRLLGVDEKFGDGGRKVGLGENAPVSDRGANGFTVHVLELWLLHELTGANFTKYTAHGFARVRRVCQGACI